MHLHRSMMGWTLAAALVAAGCGDQGTEESSDGGGDLAATCEQMASIEGPDDITVERLDQLLEVAVDEVREPVQYIRDRIAEDGEAAFEDEEVGRRFEQVGAFEEAEC